MYAIRMWLIFAASASALWGLSYALSEQIYKYTSIYTTLAIDTFIISIAFFIASWAKGLLKQDVVAITSSPKVFGLFISGLVVFALAELFIALSITSKNATLAGLIEISYPLFIALFAYLLFRESQLNWGVAAGGLLIFLGVTTVFWFSR